MPRPNPHSNTQIAQMMSLHGENEEEARKRLKAMMSGYDIGLWEGRAEAQRFFRLALGVEIPEQDERVLWNNPVPLREELTCPD